ncbi:MAG: anti-sigma factor domain-containing protein [Bacillaceae bacterium]|nr:anti-sigma factor domain-containing protein [Bacillaceae bacterium]
MKKGIVMEKKDQYVVVMSHDGTFYKAKPIPGCDIGEEIQFEPIIEPVSTRSAGPSLFHTFFNKRLIAAVAVLLLALFPVFSWYSSTKAYAYVSIDINPSIEMTVNKKLEVLELTPINDSARELIEKLDDWEGQTVEKVTFDIIEISKQEGMMEGRSVLIGVSYLKEVNGNLTEKIETFLQEREEDVPIAAFEVPENIREQAKEEKVSMNYLMAEKIVKEKKLTKENDDEEKDKGATSQNAEVEHDIPQTILKHLDEQEKQILEKYFYEVTKEIPPGWKKKLEERELPPGLQKKLEDQAEKMIPDQNGQTGDELDSEDQKHPGFELPPGLKKKLDDDAEEIEEMLKDLPPGIRKKFPEDINDLEDFLEDLPQEFRDKFLNEQMNWPPGLQKKFEDEMKSWSPDLHKKFEDEIKSWPPGLQKKFWDEKEDRKSEFFKHDKKDRTPPGHQKKEHKD